MSDRKPSQPILFTHLNTSIHLFIFQIRGILFKASFFFFNQTRFRIFFAQNNSNFYALAAYSQVSKSLVMAHMSTLETVRLLILQRVMEYILQATCQRKQFCPLMDEVSQRSSARRRLKSICSFRLCQHDCLRMQAGSSGAAYCECPPQWE